MLSENVKLSILHTHFVLLILIDVATTFATPGEYLLSLCCIVQLCKVSPVLVLQLRRSCALQDIWTVLGDSYKKSMAYLLTYEVCPTMNYMLLWHFNKLDLNEGIKSRNINIQQIRTILQEDINKQSRTPCTWQQPLETRSGHKHVYHRDAYFYTIGQHQEEHR